MQLDYFLSLITALALQGTPSPLHHAMDDALAAQRQFERVRLQHMPYGPSAPTAGGCDQFIGRFCYRFGDRSVRQEPVPEEHTEVARARSALLRTLRTAAERDPGSEWITGTYVRYLLEANDSEAIDAASRCGAQGWWCHALRGYVLHTLSRHAASFAAFDSARALMSQAELCEWDDISTLLGSEERRLYKALPCGERIAITRTAWWLGKPLFTRPGNERRSEHDSRRVLQRLLATGVNPIWLRWGDDMTELVLRFGWTNYWRRHFASMGDPDAPNPAITQYHALPSYHFLPAWRALTGPLQADESDWVLLPQYSREEYSPHGTTFAPLRMQRARMLRGDSILLLVRLNLESEATLRGSDRPSMAVALSSAADHLEVLPRSVVDPARATAIPLANSTTVASIEVTGDSSHYARARFATGALNRDVRGRALSDMVLHKPLPGDTATLDLLLTSMYHDETMGQGAGVGIYWEMYGLQRGDSVDVAVVVAPGRQGFLRRIGSALGIGGRSSASSVQWREVVTSDDPVAPRSVTLEMRAISPGETTIHMSLTVNGESTFERSRIVRVVRD